MVLIRRNILSNLRCFLDGNKLKDNNNQINISENESIAEIATKIGKLNLKNTKSDMVFAVANRLAKYNHGDIEHIFSEINI